MNQHFLNNTLYGIQCFINSGEMEASLVYITKPGRLLRAWGQQSGQQAISLHDEHALLAHYLMLEELRSPGHFTFKVTTNVTAAKTVFVAPHIIFPLTEHAVAWCAGQMLPSAISIFVSQDMQLLHCAVAAPAGDKIFNAGLHLVPQNISACVCNEPL